ARGAFNNLLSHEISQAGIVAASGGNHGAACAYAAKQLGIAANIFVPEISAPAKIARIEQYGARIHIGGARYADALRASEQFIADHGALGIHAYDHPATLAGQGTLGLEWHKQAPELDTIIIAVGGGGLIGGVAAWYERDVKIIAVEPVTSRALNAALEAGHPVDVEVAGVAADSLGARSVGELMFPIAKDYVAESLLVDDDAIRAAQRALWQELQIIAEPGGAAALAVLMSGGYRPEATERVGVLVCGANADPATLNL
ncbi:MAG: serine/threonine dehydratase, partial [Fimbriimonadaceae bacterium]|nr:serine/threonine dehydratase [Alphaproteobacteria bacterium]